MTNYYHDYDEYKLEIEQGIEEVFKKAKKDMPRELYDSMKYSVTNGGKRIRGVLVLATCHMLNVDFYTAMDFAVAVEMVHASSLIHDDLPCMDDDTMRRGKPCNHIVFGEAVALYAGVGLLNFAYEHLLLKADSIQYTKAIGVLARAAGVTGIVKGQSMDILYEGKEIDFETLKTIHKSKTGALINACLTIPATLASASQPTMDVLSNFGSSIGVAFQIVDDVLDVTSTSSELGKTAGKDLEADKLTHVKVFGVDKAMKMAEEEINSAISGLESILCDSCFLADTAKLILNRRN